MDPKLTTRNSPHRGAKDNFSVFGPKFIEGRLAGFSKDMEICLTPIPARDRDGDTHAYFPSLAACCGLLEYLTGLFVGKINGLSHVQIRQYAERYLPQPDYNSDTIYILHNAFRNPVAHRGIASGVWLDQSQGKKRRRLTWMVSESAQKPAVKLVEENSIITRDSPWNCPYTHRVHIYLGQLCKDLEASAKLFSSELADKKKLQDNFRKCMLQLYPK